MQCQSRLSPSPPFVHQDNGTDATIASPRDTETISSASFYDTTLSSINLECSPTDDKEQSPPTQIDEDQENKSPEYGSRYSSILEKSRNLDERYNNLILNASVMNLRTLPDESQPKSDLISEQDFKYDSIDLSAIDSYRISRCDDFVCGSQRMSDQDGESKENLSLSLEEGASLCSPASPRMSTLKSPSDKSPGSKSPNRVFNPFPIPMNSRQNKEVPLKLGLYKK
jgi:hypothetical protein